MVEQPKGRSTFKSMRRTVPWPVYLFITRDARSRIPANRAEGVYDQFGDGHWAIYAGQVRFELLGGLD